LRRPPAVPSPSLLASAVLVATLAAAAPAAAQPGFSKAFVPDTVALDGHSRLVFTVDNTAGGAPATGLAFSDTLPAGVVLASPPSAATTCGVGATLAAPGGGTTITFSGGQVAAGASCQVAVDVQGTTPGDHLNTSGDLTSSAGDSGTAAATLTVDAGRVRFGKQFSPDAVQVGGDSTLTFTLENPVESIRGSVSFSDTLPAGLAIASPANATNTCGGTLTAPAGGTTISLSLATLFAFETCTVTVDVTPTVAGSLVNRTDPLTQAGTGSGFAVDELLAAVDTLALEKEFLGDPLPPGFTLPLRFTLRNLDRGGTATGLAFTDDLDATLTGLAAVPPLPAAPCGAGSTLSGTSELSLTGGTLGPGESCTFEVDVEIPAGAEPGSYPNTTSTVTGDLGGVTEVGAPATDDLLVQEVPLLTKTFLDDPVAGGDSVVIELTLTNTSADPLQSASFTDDVGAQVGSAAVTAEPPAGFCGPGSSSGVLNGVVIFTNMRLAGGDSCTFSITIELAVNVPAATYTNTTSPVSGLLGGEEPVTGPPASDDLTVVEGPDLGKSFLSSPVLAGDTVDLELTLSAGESPTAPDVTGIAFTDDLDAALSGLQAVALPADGFCGAGSQISGTSVLSITGASVEGGGSCSFTVTLQVPAGALPGSYLNTTSTVTGTSEGLEVAGLAASDTLQVGGLVFTKSFLDDPVVAGQTADLQFTLTNLSATAAVTGAAFTDDLDADLPGLTVAGALPVAPCGAGSVLTEMGATLTLTGGNLATAGSVGDSCTFSISVQVPAGTPAGQYTNTTSPLTADFGGEPVVVPPASDDLQVIEPLSIAKDFIDDPVGPGGTVTLELTLSNAHPTEAASDLTFTDDLDAVLSGLVAVGLPQMDVCGAGSTLSGTSVLTLTGGTVAAADSCTFQVTLQVPADAPSSTFLNTTSPLSGMVGGAAATAPPATAALQVAGVAFAKAFAAPAGAGGTVQLTFTLTNLSAMAAVDGLGFTDDLGAVLPGLAAVGLPMSGVCGAGSQISGTTVLTFTGGSLAAGGSCDFAVTLQVPADAAPGSYANVTSVVTSSGLQVGEPAADDLVIEPAPLFAKSFSPPAIESGGVATLLFTIDNSAAAVAATGLAFTDVLPAGLTVAAVPNASTTCTGGTLTAVAGTGTVSYSGGSVAAGAACTVQVDVTAVTGGTYVNTSGELTSSLGASGTAEASLVVEGAPPPPVLEIPTLSQWGLLLLALLVGWIGWRRLG
jgi:uncharacterized repeat protein (TIGR01451 family)